MLKLVPLIYFMVKASICLLIDTSTSGTMKLLGILSLLEFSASMVYSLLAKIIPLVRYSFLVIFLFHNNYI